MCFPIMGLAAIKDRKNLSVSILLKYLYLGTNHLPILVYLQLDCKIVDLPKFILFGFGYKDILIRISVRVRQDFSCPVEKKNMFFILISQI